MNDNVKPTAYLQEKPTFSDPRLKNRHVSFFGSVEKGDTPLYTLEQACRLLGVEMPERYKR